MSETSAEIFAESSKLSMVVNPGHEPTSNVPADTTRSPDAIEADIEKQEDIIVRYSAAVLEETGKPAQRQLDAKPYWDLKYKLSHYLQEHRYALAKGNA
jgi:hypothetical protein